jgi:hypothetical protein
LSSSGSKENLVVGLIIGLGVKGLVWLDLQVECVGCYPVPRFLLSF